MRAYFIWCSIASEKQHYMFHIQRTTFTSTAKFTSIHKYLRCENSAVSVNTETVFGFCRSRIHWILQFKHWHTGTTKFTSEMLMLRNITIVKYLPWFRFLTVSFNFIHNFILRMYNLPVVSCHSNSNIFILNLLCMVFMLQNLNINIISYPSAGWLYRMYSATDSLGLVCV